MIVIGTSFGREQWATDCLETMPDDIPVMVVSQYPFELGKIRWVLEYTDVERFWFLQDSVLIHEPAFLRAGLALNGAVSLCQDPRPLGMYMGVYDRSVLTEVGVPEVTTKEESIRLEIDWTCRYLTAAGSVEVMFPEFADRNAIGVTKRHGRDNLVLHNDSLTKFKGTWS